MRFTRNTKAQIAAIITLLIVVVFLLAIVFINLAKLSEVKTLTSRVADRAGLHLASQIGSISHYLVEKIGLTDGDGDGQYSKCSTNWMALAMIIGGILLAALSLVTGQFLNPMVAVASLALFGAGVVDAYTFSMPINKAIAEQFKGMSAYNSLREQTLLEALSSLQSDAAVLNNSGGGIFHDDTTGLDYDLSGIESMRNLPKAGRFSAWYYSRRLNLVSEEGLEAEVNAFLNNLRNYIKVADWNNAKWRFDKASLVVGPATVTSSPSWVYDAATGKVSVITIKENTVAEPNNRGSDGYYEPFGFLREALWHTRDDIKFSLFRRLEEKYGVSFCGTSCPWCRVSCDSVNDLIDNFTFLVGKTKELIDLPINLRLPGVGEWFPDFYDSESTHTAAGGDEDIYDRLTQDENRLTDWIIELGGLNTGIIAEIVTGAGECTWGRGFAAVGTCYGTYGTSCAECGCGPCSDCECCNTCCFPSTIIQPCAYRGSYYTCCQNPLVCSEGDLYGAIPPWCASHGNHVNCDANCQCDVQNFDCGGNGRFFQGQLAWDNTTGPNEVTQAIEILRLLLDATRELKAYIILLRDALSTLLPQNDPTRNAIVYAWKDKDVTDKDGVFIKDGNSRLVAVRLDGYPAQLPYVKHKKYWGGIKRCLLLRGGSDNKGKGDFQLSTWRYDEDKPAPPSWTMRYRKNPKEAQFEPAKLRAIFQDIQDNGKPDSTSGDLAGLLGVDIFSQTPIPATISTNAIVSTTTAAYGPEMTQIRIVKTEGD